MRKNIKIVLILLSIIIVLINSTVLATTIDTEKYNPGHIDRNEGKRITSMAGKVLGTIRNVGVVISVIIISIIGLKYMLCSLEEKANYKENMIPYVVGCFLLALATTIPSIIYDVLN